LVIELLASIRYSNNRHSPRRRRLQRAQQRSVSTRTNCYWLAAVGYKWISAKLS